MTKPQQEFIDAIEKELGPLSSEEKQLALINLSNGLEWVIRRIREERALEINNDDDPTPPPPRFDGPGM